MANETMSLISTVTVGSGGAASIDFASIPGTYTDLQIVLSLRETTISGAFFIDLNALTTNFSSKQLIGYGLGVTSFNRSDNIIALAVNESATTANVFSSIVGYFPNYAGSTNKSFSFDSVTEANATSGSNDVLTTALWSNTAAINRITITAGGTSFAQYSSASLYGILKGSGGATVS